MERDRHRVQVNVVDVLVTQTRDRLRVYECVSRECVSETEAIDRQTQNDRVCVMPE